jgi:hypothetical protein
MTALQKLVDSIHATAVLDAAMERARHRDQPHFRTVILPDRPLIGNGPDDCLVCDMPLPDRDPKTIQYFHGECRKHRIAIRKF